ncbi:hypothetical protein HanIR_Chr01g0030791 [Helianthus annuus]|nr:hypothetical protein HanIR_Chr01g0030791 [Helianthus annuus]
MEHREIAATYYQLKLPQQGAQTHGTPPSSHQEDAEQPHILKSSLAQEAPAYLSAQYTPFPSSPPQDALDEPLPQEQSSHRTAAQ